VCVLPHIVRVWIETALEVRAVRVYVGKYSQSWIETALEVRAVRVYTAQGHPERALLMHATWSARRGDRPI